MLTWKRVTSGFVALTIFIWLVPATPPARAAQPDCGLVQDCGFDDFYGQAGAGSGVWKLFKVSGSSGFSLADWEGWPSGPSVKLSSNSPFDAGIYQRVSVAPGVGYQFSIPFAVVDINGQGWHEGDAVSRRLGIDPYGGTNPDAPVVKWSSDFFGRGKFQDDQLTVSEYARSSTLTVFIRVINPYDDRHLDVFLDSPRLVVDSGMPPILVPSPTLTQPPPTALPPTRKPTQVPTLALQPTATLAPTETPTPTLTPAPSATSDPTATPKRTATRPGRATPSPSPASPTDSGVSARVLALTLFGATTVLGLAGSAALFIAGWLYWRRSQKRPSP